MDWVVSRAETSSDLGFNKFTLIPKVENRLHLARTKAGRPARNSGREEVMVAWAWEGDSGYDALCQG